MPKTKDRAPLLSPLAQQPAPVIQSMPNARVRLDPSIVPDLMCWLLMLRYRFYRMAGQTLRGLKGAERVRAKGNIKYARDMMRCLDQIIDSFSQTMDARELDETRRGLGLPQIP